MLKITAEEINFIIYQYLQEAGKSLLLKGSSTLLTLLKRSQT